MIKVVDGVSFYASKKTMDKNHITYYRVIKDEDAIALLDKLNEKLMEKVWSKELPRKYEIDSCVLCVANPFDDDSYYLPTMEGLLSGHSQNCCIIFPTDMSQLLQDELTYKVIDTVKELGIPIRLADTDGECVFFDIDFDTLEEKSKNF